MTEPDTRAQVPPHAALDPLRDELARSPGVILESVADRWGVPLHTVVGCLPDGMRTEVSGEHFVAVMDEVRQWGPLTFLVHTPDGVFEFAGPIPGGSEGRGFFNLQAEGGFGGHLRADRCASIIFLRRPFMGKATASLQFFNGTGGSMFKIFVGRDPSGELRRDQLDRFERLEHRLARRNEA